jgi:predicted ribosome quality control (RQC) complex YloA/Tae2 family protein
MAGASSTIIKNHTDQAIPHLTMHEASMFTIGFSHAWDSKIVV